MFMRRKQLTEIMRRSGRSGIEERFHFLREEMKKLTNCDEDHVNELNKQLSYFKSEYKTRWMKACRMHCKFVNNNKVWLETSIAFPRFKVTRRGRPEMTFEACSERTKRLKTKQLRDCTPVSVLSYATQMGLRSEGQSQASTLLKELTNASPERAGKYRKAYRRSLEPPQLMSGDDALAVLVDAKLSRYQYDVIRTCAPEKFPSYKTIQAAKKHCYPEEMHITDTCGEIALQALLDHTVTRLLLTVEPVIQTLQNEELETLCLLSKWGFDGSSGHSSYKQAFHGPASSDSAVFMTCIVPIRLLCGEKTIWQNPRPASTRYCRPVKIEYIRESSVVSIAEKKRMDRQIEHLQKSNSLVQGRNVHVRHNVIFAMVDGKVCNALTDTTSTQKCYICGATCKDFNNVEVMIKRHVNTANLGFGLSVLHGWIRMFECLLHVAYKLPIKKWQARGSDKAIVSQNKARIQEEFRRRCGLIIDTPKPGLGNTNDGNTARRFFKDAECASEITHLDLDLLNRIHIIMVVVSSGHEIDVRKFRAFAHDTARCFVEQYPWYNMPPTMHKYLIHGPEIIASALLPIGQLTEEAQEARNKDFKNYREHYTRKCSREKCNEDILKLFLISSDPFITSKRKLQRKPMQHLPAEALDLLQSPTQQVRSHGDNYVDNDDASATDSDDCGVDDII